MYDYDAHNLVVHPTASSDPDLIVEVTQKQAGWETLSFQSRRLSPGQAWSFTLNNQELALVVLGGVLNVSSSRGDWHGIGKRTDVFSGLPFALYLPRHTHFTVNAETQCDYTLAWVDAKRDFPPRLITPSDIWVEIRGGDHATRQINSLIPPGFPCDRLVMVEVYTPAGNWSSYPPHKHDVHRVDQDGHLIEADLDEIYYYQIEPPEGFAIQRIYTDPTSPLHRAAHPIDVTIAARHQDVVLIPEGYHPVSAPPGYKTYYLNILAGSAQSLAASDDPAYAWVKQSYQGRDPRVPVYDISGAAGIR